MRPKAKIELDDIRTIDSTFEDWWRIQKPANIDRKMLALLKSQARKSFFAGWVERGRVQ